MVTKSTTSFGFVQVDKSVYDVSYTNSATVKVNGTVLSPISGDTKITILFQLPDGTTTGSEVAMLSNGYFETSFPLDSNSQKGTYSILVSYASNMVGSVYFTVKQVAAKSILNEIANQTVSKPVTSQNNDQGSKSNVALKTTSAASSSKAQSPSTTIDITKPSKLPTWIKRIFVWYGQGQISEDDLIGAIEYLVQNGLIKIKTTSNANPSTQTQPSQQSTQSPAQKPNPPSTVSTTNDNILRNSDFVKVQNNPDDYVDHWAKLSGSFTQRSIRSRWIKLGSF